MAEVPRSDITATGEHMSTHDHSNPHDIPPHLRALDELLIGEAQEATNILLDCQGAALLQMIDNRIDKKLKLWEKDMQKRMRIQQGIREQ
jgi:hypothetical protein